MKKTSPSSICKAWGTNGDDVLTREEYATTTR